MMESEIKVGHRYRTRWGIIEVIGFDSHPEDGRMVYWAKDDPGGYFAAEIIEEASNDPDGQPSWMCERPGLCNSTDLCASADRCLWKAHQ